MEGPEKRNKKRKNFKSCRCVKHVKEGGESPLWRHGPWRKTDNPHPALFHALVCADCGMLAPTDVIRLVKAGWELKKSRRNPKRFYLTPKGVLAAISKRIHEVGMVLQHAVDLPPSMRLVTRPFSSHEIPYPKVVCTPLNFTAIESAALKEAAAKNRETS